MSPRVRVKNNTPALLISRHLFAFSEDFDAVHGATVTNVLRARNTPNVTRREGGILFRKTVPAIILSLLIVSTLTLAFKIPIVRADGGTITINSDGSITPSTAPIYTPDNITYTLTGSISAQNEGILVERDDITVDGAGYSVDVVPYIYGPLPYAPNGVYLDGVSNVTIMDMTIDSYFGVLLNSSSNNIICENNITKGEAGIWIESSSNNTVSGNNITNSTYYSIVLDSSNYTGISGNTFTNDGLYVVDSYQNFVQNNTVNGKPLVYLEEASNLIVDNDAGQVVLVDCENIAAEDLNLSETDFALELWETNNSTISGNNITNNPYGIGISLIYSSGNIISGNNIAYNEFGLGIWLESSSNNSISGNNITNNIEGIVLDYSTNNSISEDNITANIDYAVTLYSSSNNSISGDNITNNVEAFWIESSSDYNSIYENNITNNGQGIWIYLSSDYNSISENDIISGGHSVAVEFSSTNSISENNITSTNDAGLFISVSSGNIISGNNVTDSVKGIWVYSCSGNSIFHNRFINNTIQVMSNDSTNIWDNGYPSGGNYWSDYNGKDMYSGVYQNETGKDLIGDTPYVIDSNNIDHYPLVNPPISFRPQNWLAT